MGDGIIKTISCDPDSFHYLSRNFFFHSISVSVPFLSLSLFLSFLFSPSFFFLFFLDPNPGGWAISTCRVRVRFLRTVKNSQVFDVDPSAYTAGSLATVNAKIVQQTYTHTHRHSYIQACRSVL